MARRFKPNETEPDDSPWTCWACHARINWDTGVSLTAKGVEVCKVCWEKIPIADRIRLVAMLRDRADGGLGIGDCLQAFGDLAKAATDGWQWPGRNTEFGEN